MKYGMTYSMKYGWRYGLAVLLPMIGLAGCGQLSETFGYGKNPPDEFAIIRKSPLIIPPDYQLKPPLTNLEGLQRLPEQNDARALLTKAPPPPADIELSQGERNLLMQAGASNSSDSIRAQIDRDGQTVVRKKGNFVERILFGFGRKDEEEFGREKLERESTSESDTESEVKSKAEAEDKAKARSRSRARVKR